MIKESIPDAEITITDLAGDNNHFSHRLVRTGQPKTTAVLLLLLVSAAIGAMTLFV